MTVILLFIIYISIYLGWVPVLRGHGPCAYTGDPCTGGAQPPPQRGRRRRYARAHRGVLHPKSQSLVRRRRKRNHVQVLISIYIYIYLYLSIFIYIYLYISIFIYIYLYLSIYIYIYLYISISIYILYVDPKEIQNLKLGFNFGDDRRKKFVKRSFNVIMNTILYWNGNVLILNT